VASGLARLRAILKYCIGPAKRKIEADLFWIQRRYVLAAPVAGFPDVTPKLPVTFRYGDAADIGRLGELHDYDEASREHARRRLAAGDRIVIATHGDAIVYYAWLMHGQMDLDFNNFVPISAGRIYSYKLFTVEEFRGCKICPAYYAFLRDSIAGEGYREALVWVAASNARSLKVHANAGFSRIGTYWQVRIGHSLTYVVPPGLPRRLLAASYSSCSNNS
jgi:hypothetical protein